MSSANLTPEIGTVLRQDPVLSESKLHEIVGEALKQSSRFKTREQIAQDLSQLTGLRITKRRIDDWACGSKGHIHIPAIAVEPLARITGTPSLEMAVVGEYVRELAMFGANVLGIRRNLALALEQLIRLGGKDSAEYLALARRFRQAAIDRHWPMTSRAPGSKTRKVRRK
jgi:hypothetical protein